MMILFDVQDLLEVSIANGKRGDGSSRSLSPRVSVGSLTATLVGRLARSGPGGE